MEKNVIRADQLVAEVMNRWPQTIPVFIKYHISCVGCSMSKFDTIADAAQNYKLALDAFLADLNRSLITGATEE